MKAAILPSGDVSIHLSSDEAAPIILTLTRWVLAQETAVGLSVFSREFWRQLKRRDIERKRLYAHGLTLIDVIAKATADNAADGGRK